MANSAPIMGPLAAQLFDLGKIQTGGMNRQMYAAPTQQLADPITSPGGGAPAPAPARKNSSGALLNAGLMAADAYMGSQSGSTPPDANGNGFGLGGKIADGEITEATYAGTQNATAASLFSKPDQTTVQIDNGYRDPNPYAADYGQAVSAKPSLFTYGGSYGGATY